jgi:hypothetical protein
LGGKSSVNSVEFTAFSGISKQQATGSTLSRWVLVVGVCWISNDDARTTKCALEQRNISFWVCRPMAQNRDQPHLPMADRYNDGNDYQVMVLPYRQE